VTTPTPTGTIPVQNVTATPTPVTPTSTPQSNNNNDNASSNNNNSNDDGSSNGNDNVITFTRQRNDNQSSNSNVGNIPGFNYPGVLSAQPNSNTPTPGVLSVIPRQQPGVAAAQPAQVPGVANQAPRPIQTPSVLPVAGSLGADLPRLAALAGIGLVASGLGLRLRERLFGGRRPSVPPAAPEYEADVADTYLDDRM